MQRQSQKDTLVLMRSALLFWSWRMGVCSGFLLGAGSIAQTVNDQTSAEITNVHQIRLLAAQIPKTSYSIRLEGDVWWANPSRGKLVLKDDSGVEELEMDLHGESVESGQRIRLEGNGTITPAGAGFKIGSKGPVVDNNGVHVMIEKSGAVFLKAGLNPIRVEWFNGVEKYGLKVEYEGPALSRQKIPDSALFRVNVAGTSGASNRVNGLNFQCSEALDEVLPDFSSLPVLKTGKVDNFDLRVIIRPDHIGLLFTGFLEIPRAGLYTFYATSDDGSRLFIGEPSLQLTVVGQSTLPKPQFLLVGQSMRRGEDGRWGEV